MVISTNGGGTTGYQHATNEVGFKNSSVRSQMRYLPPHTKFNSKWLVD